MKNKISFFVSLSIVFALASGVSSCGSGSSSGGGGGSDDNGSGIHANSVSGTITLQFENTSLAQTSLSAMRSNASSSTVASPTFYGMKLIAAYLAEDIDPDTQSNIGQTLMFYLNEDCQEDISHCDISGGTAEDGEPISQIIGVDNYFDLTNPVTANEALSEQRRDIIAGTFQYVRMEFSKINEENAPNVEWSYTGVPLRSFVTNQHTVTSAKVSPPIVITSTSSAVTFVATYDPSGSVSIGPDAAGDDCTNDESGNRVCFTIPTFTPSVNQQ